MRKILEFADRVCSRCGVRKPMDGFRKHAGAAGGRDYRCLECDRKQWSVDYRENPKKFKDKSAKRRLGRGDEFRAKSRAYNQANKKRLSRYAASYAKERRARDLNFKARQDLRSQLTHSMRTGSAGPLVLELLDITSSAELRSHFERQFESGMSWDNYGRGGWEVDHIKPLCQFDLTDPVQRKEAFALSNLRPKWWNQNRGLNRYKKA